MRNARTFSQAVLVDMEEGVVGELLNGPLGEVFDNQQLLTDVSGSGNNWYAHKNIFTKSLSVEIDSLVENLLFFQYQLLASYQRIMVPVDVGVIHIYVNQRI